MVVQAAHSGPDGAGGSSHFFVLGAGAFCLAFHLEERTNHGLNHSKSSAFGQVWPPA